MIFAITPSGSRIEKLIAPGPMGTECPFISVTSPAKKSSCDDAEAASLIIAVKGLPQSIASIAASSRAFWRTI
jgi:hypothetical protein